MDVKTLADAMLVNQQTLSTVESCTGGGIAARCTDLPGSSAWFLGGVVTYANEMKVALGVSATDIEQQGAVSQPVVEQMAKRGLQYCSSDWCVAVSGVAGPDGGTPEKPVGTVWLAWANAEGVSSQCCLFEGDRHFIRKQTVEFALQHLIELLN